MQPKRKPAHSIRRNAQEDETKCFKCEGVGHRYKDCPNRRLERERVAHVVSPQKAQQEEWRRSLENALQQRAFKHCGKGVPEEVDLFKLGWSNGEVVVSYLTCEDCGKEGYHVTEDRGQRVVKGKEWEELKKCGECLRKGRGKAVLCH